MGAIFSICFELSAMPSLPQGISLKSASLRKLRSLAPWAIQLVMLFETVLFVEAKDSREFLVRTKKFAIKEHIQCRFEGFGSSERCRCEDFKQQRGDSAITGLHSNWVTEHILATARPSDALIKDYSIVEQFQACGLSAIFNLQEPGEHGDCGPGIKVESGFSYTPETFMKKQIFYYNFPWRDMTCPSVEYTFNIVAVMDFHISRGMKVAVHCHSGLGRTGLVIACYFVYTGQQNAVSAVELVRKHRPGALQTKHQVLLVKEFEDYLAGLKIVYVQPWQSLDSSGTKGTHPTLEVLMSRQRKILHGEESRLLRYTPKILVYIIKELSKRIIANQENREKITAAFLQGMAAAFTTEKDQSLISSVQAAKRQLNAGHWEVVNNLDIEVLVQLFLDWLHLLQEPIVPDTALSRALSRGEIQGANYELKRGGKCSFFTVRLLACWMLQVVPPDKNPRRRLFSALAHVLLQPSHLPSAGRMETRGARHSDSSDDEYYRKHKLRRCSSFCPSLLDVEFGLLLEAAAKYWWKVLCAQRRLGPVSSHSPRLKESKSDDLWVYDKAGVEAEICSNSDDFDESEITNEDEQEYLSAVCVEGIVNEVSSNFVLLPSPVSSLRSSPRSSRPASSGMSTG